MKSIKQIVEEKNYDQILKLEGEEYDAYKCITLIKLEKYKEAIKYAKPCSFELAYANYKLKNFKKCLRIIRKSQEASAKFIVLKSQALYNMGRYNEAYKILSQLPLDDELVINLQAIKSLAFVADMSEHRTPSKYSLMKGDDSVKFDDFSRYKFRDKELEEEFRYNETFASILEEGKYVSILTTLGEKYRSGVVKRQLDNVLGNFEKISKSSLNNSDAQILEFNRDERTSFENPVHYQRNFSGIKGRYWPGNDYICYLEARSLDYNLGNAQLPRISDNLLILLAFINLKKMFRSEKFSRKFFEKNSQSLPWEIIELLAMKNNEIKKSQERVVSLLYKLY